MSRENVEVVRRLYGAYGDGDLEATIQAVCDPDIEWHASEGFGLLRGRDAVLRHFKSFVDTFEHWQVVADELIDAGNEIVGVTRVRGTGKASELAVDARYAIVFLVRDNLILCAREHATRADALEAVGLAE